MAAYYILVGAPIYLSLFMMNKKTLSVKPEKQKYVIGTFFLVYLLLLCLRHNTVGVDLSQYLPRFNSIARTPWNEIFVVFGIEPGYVFLNKLIGVFSTNEQIFLSVIALITVLPLMKLYCDESENAILSMALFLIMPNLQMIFSGLRQAIAMALVVPAYYATKKKKLIPFILIVLLAMTFHKSAFIIAAIYPVYHMNITRNRAFLIGLPILSVIYIFRNYVFSILLRFMSDDGEENYGDLTTEGGYTMLILFVLFAVVSYVCASNEKLDRDVIGLRNLLLLSVVLQFFASVNPLAMRMNYYFLLFIPLLIPKIINRTPDKERGIYKAGGMALSMLLLFYYFYKAYTGYDILCIYPYRFFWQ